MLRIYYRSLQNHLAPPLRAEKVKILVRNVLTGIVCFVSFFVLRFLFLLGNKLSFTVKLKRSIVQESGQKVMFSRREGSESSRRSFLSLSVWYFFLDSVDSASHCVRRPRLPVQVAEHRRRPSVRWPACSLLVRELLVGRPRTESDNEERSSRCLCSRSAFQRVCVMTFSIDGVSLHYSLDGKTCFRSVGNNIAISFAVSGRQTIPTRRKSRKEVEGKRASAFRKNEDYLSTETIFPRRF